MATIPTRAAFLASFVGSAFNATNPPTLIDLALTDAAARTSDRVYKADAVERAVFYLAAVLLYRHPKSFPMRQANPGQDYEWERELRGMQRAATIGLRNT